MRPRRARLVTLLAAAAATACGPAAPSRPNLLLVSIDTLRADALGAYGGPVATPAFDALAAQGVRFERAVAAAPETGPSHATLFCGQDPLRHGLVRNGLPLAEGTLTLAEVLRGAGYATGGFVSAFVLDPRFGFAQGFDAYDAEFPRAGETLSERSAWWARFEFEGFDRRAPQTNARALAWLASAREPFFAFVHYYDPHLPYLATPEQLAEIPEPFARRAARERIASLRAALPGLRARELEQSLRSYQAEVLFADRALGELLAALEARGIGERTLVAVTSDHGEGLGQHGSLDHAPNLYEEQLHVPLALRWPGRLAGGVRIATPVGLVDLAPTLAELAGVAFASPLDGRSLAPSLLAAGAPPPEPRPIVGRRRHYPKPFQGHRGTKFFVRHGDWKYIRASEDPDELYDLSEDPGERRDLAAKRPGELARLSAVLDARLAAHPQREPEPGLDEATRRGLEALGYLE